MARFAIGHDDVEFQLVSGTRLLGRRLDRDGGDRPFRPQVCDLRDDRLATDPFLRERNMFLPVGQLHDARHEHVGGDRAVVAVLAIIGRPANGSRFPRRRIGRVGHQTHVAVDAREILVGIVLVPVTLLPLVELVLSGTQARSIECFGDELLVTRSAKLGRAKYRTIVVGQMLPRKRADEKVRDLLAPTGRSFPEVLARRREDVIGVPPFIDARNRVADNAGDSFLHAGCRERLVVDVLGTGEQGNGIMAAGAIPRFRRLPLLSKKLLHGLKWRVHR